MINPDVIEAFNTRLVTNPNNIKTMSPVQKQKILDAGTEAENLLKNKHLALTIHQFKFESMDELTQIKAHDLDSNNKRVAISNQLTGIDNYIAFLQKAIYYKQQVVRLNTPAEESTQ